MPTEGATNISQLDPARPADTEVIGESDDHHRMLKTAIKGNFVDIVSPPDAWDIPLTIGPRTINGWEARIAAVEGELPNKANTVDAAVKTHFNDSGDVAEVKHAGVTVLQTAVGAIDVVGTRLTAKAGSTAQVSLQAINTAGGGQFEANAVDASVRVVQLSAAGAEEQTWMLMTRGQGVAVFHGGLQAFASTSARGLSVTDQVTANAAAPTAVNHLTRKDYVDAQVASLQSQIDNIVSGATAFTGTVTAPDFNATG